MFLVLLLYVLFASTFTLGKLAVTYMPPVLLIGVRMMIGGAGILAYQYFFNRSEWRFEWSDIVPIARVSFFLMYVSFIAEFWSVQYLTAAKACLLYNLSPFITALFAYYIVRERLTRQQLVGLMIGFLGFIPILVNQSGLEVLTPHLGFISMPECMMILSVATSCYGLIIMKYLVGEREYSPFMINGIAMFFAGIMALMSSFIVEGMPAVRIVSVGHFGLSPAAYSLCMAIVCTLALVLISQVVCFNLYGFLLRRYSATFIAFAGFTTPLFAALFDLIFFREMVPMAFFITVGIVSIGLYIFYQHELQVL